MSVNPLDDHGYVLVDKGFVSEVCKKVIAEINSQRSECEAVAKVSIDSMVDKFMNSRWFKFLHRSSMDRGDVENYLITRMNLSSRYNLISWKYWREEERYMLENVLNSCEITSESTVFLSIKLASYFTKKR
jgi:HD-GYP domain-containing protein (c-di-GMP phosphodiesterase class II)